MLKNLKSGIKRLNYKWVIVVVCGLMVFVCLGFCSSSKSIYTFAITENLKIPRGAYSLSDTFRYAATALVNVFFGGLMAKFGSKKLILTGFVFLILSSLVCSIAVSAPMFYLGGALLGLGLSFTTTTMVGSVVNKWCKKNKGTIMGFVLATNGIGAALATQVVTPIIYDEKNPLGFQNAFRLTAIILFFVAVVVLIFFKDKPLIEEEHDKTDIAKKNSEWDGIKFSKAVRTPYFYMVAISVFITGFILQSFSAAASLHMQDMGISHAFVATVLSVNSVVLTFAKFLAGVIYDKFSLRATVIITTVSSLISFVCVLLIKCNSTGYVLAMIFAVLGAVGQPLQTVMLPIYAGELFGQRAYDKILGIFVSINMVGCAIGSPVINLMYDIIGNYRMAFVIGSALIAVMLILMLLSISAASREKAKRSE